MLGSVATGNFRDLADEEVLPRDVYESDCKSCLDPTSLREDMLDSCRRYVCNYVDSSSAGMLQHSSGRLRSAAQRCSQANALLVEGVK